MSERFGHRLAPPLARDDAEETRVPDQISATEAARLADETVEPFATDAVGPLGCALVQAGLSVEGRAHGDRRADGERGTVLDHPQLLFGSTEGDAEQVGPGFRDLASDAGAFDWIVFKTWRWAADSGEAEAGVFRLEFVGGSFRGSGEASQKKNGETVARRFDAEPFHEIASSDALGNGMSEKVRGKNDGDAVGDGKIGGAQGGGEARLPRGERDQLGVGSHDEQGLAWPSVAQRLNDPSGGVFQRHAIDGGSVQVEARWPGRGSLEKFGFGKRALQARERARIEYEEFGRECWR